VLSRLVHEKAHFGVRGLEIHMKALFAQRAAGNRPDGAHHNSCEAAAQIPLPIHFLRDFEQVHDLHGSRE